MSVASSFGVEVNEFVAPSIGGAEDVDESGWYPGKVDFKIFFSQTNCCWFVDGLASYFNFDPGISSFFTVIE